MQSFIYQGVIAYYKIIDGKIIVFSVDYNGRKHECEQPFNSISELRRYIDAGGWSAEN